MFATRRISLALGMLTLLMMLVSPAAATAKPATSLKAAFVRGGDLWIQTNSGEQQLTKGEYIRNPKWSFDGEWIAYTRGQEEREVWIWHISTGQSHLVSKEGGGNFQWSPEHNRLAFLVEQKLYWIKVDHPDKPTEVSRGLGNYSWLPDGNGFIASSTAELLPEGWTPVSIVEIPLRGEVEHNQAKTLYELPGQSDDNFVVGTSVFKFSATGKWIAFFVTPTASLSADSNTLCILSADGAFFKRIDLMVHNSDWFAWADRGDKLAYIGGVGREATSNKQLKVLEFPSGKPVSYTPGGYVDQNFTWEGEQHIVVSRAAEWKGAGQPGQSATKPLPNLVEIKLQGPRFKPLTQPPKQFGDFNPQFLPSVHQLAWVRSDRNKSDVLISGQGGKHPSVWIKNIDLGADFYEQWRWSSVLNFYGH